MSGQNTRARGEGKEEREKGGRGGPGQEVGGRVDGVETNEKENNELAREGRPNPGEKKLG